MPVDSRGPKDDVLEVERIDPQAFMAGGMPPPPPNPARRPVTPKLEPMPLPSTAPPPKMKDPIPKAVEERALPKKPPEPIDQVVSNSVVRRLLKRFGVEQEQLVESELKVYGEKLAVSLRLPTYDDFLWAMAMIERKARAQEDASLLMSEGQRNEMLQAYVACRCVVKLDGENVWDAFEVTNQIKSIVPMWDGVDRTKVPDFFQGTLATAVMSLFRQLHPELLFALSTRVKQLDVEQARKRAEASKEVDEVDQDPTSTP